MTLIKTTNLVPITIIQIKIFMRITATMTMKKRTMQAVTPTLGNKNHTMKTVTRTITIIIQISISTKNTKIKMSIMAMNSKKTRLDADVLVEIRIITSK